MYAYFDGMAALFGDDNRGESLFHEVAETGVSVLQHGAHFQRHRFQCRRNAGEFRGWQRRQDSVLVWGKRNIWQFGPQRS